MLLAVVSRDKYWPTMNSDSHRIAIHLQCHSFGVAPNCN